MTAALDTLNPEQRRAVEHGGGAAGCGRPAAGHRRRRLRQDQHAGASRRASDRQRRRSAPHPAADLLAPRRRRDGRGASSASPRAVLAAARSGRAALHWAGTFHGIGARLLREYAGAIGLDPAFTIHDREDSADLMNLVRHELGLSATARALPDQGHLPRDLFARGQRARRRSRRCWRRPFPGAPAGRTSCSELFARLCRGQAAAERARLRRPAALLGADDGRAGARAPRSATRFDHVLVDEYQDTNRLQASILLALKPDGRGLTVVGDDAQSIYSFRAATVRNILDFPAQFRPPARIVTLEQQLPLDAADPRRRQRRDRARARALHQEPAGRSARLGAAAAAGHACATRPTRRATSSSTCWRTARRGIALKAQAVLFRASHHSRPARDRADAAQHPVRQVRRAEVPRRRARQGRAGAAALRREPARPRRRLPRRCSSCPASARRPRRAVLDAHAPRRIALRRWQASRRRRARPTTGRRSPSCSTRCSAARPAGRPSSSSVRRWYEPHLERIHDDAPMRAARPRRSSSRSPRAIRSRERFLTELTLDPPDATSDEAGAPLLDEDYLILSTIHSAKGQEWKSVFVLNVVDGCIPSDLATGSARGDRGGAPPALRRA